MIRSCHHIKNPSKTFSSPPNFSSTKRNQQQSGAGCLLSRDSFHHTFCRSVLYRHGAYRERVYRSFTRNVVDMQHSKSPFFPLQSHVSLVRGVDSCHIFASIQHPAITVSALSSQYTASVPQAQRTSNANHPNLLPSQHKNSTTPKITYPSAP